MIVLTGYTKNFFYYHESGPKNPKPNRKVSIGTLKKAADIGGKDEDIIICLGRRTGARN